MDDERRACLLSELHDEVLRAPPVGARADPAGTLCRLAEWLLRAHGLMMVAGGGGVLGIWGTGAARVALCAMLDVLRAAPSTPVPPVLIDWLHNEFLQPTKVEDDIAHMAAELLRHICAAAVPPP
jgi:hypothetical protein